MELIAANGRLAAKTALAMREGALHERLSEVRQQLVQADASISAFVDYPYEDIPEPICPASVPHSDQPETRSKGC